MCSIDPGQRGRLKLVDWLRHGLPGNCKLEEAEVEPPTLNKNETVIDAIERHRRRVRELRADLHRIASAPYPSTHVKAQIRAQIEQLAMQGPPDVSLMVEHDGKIVWPTQRLQSQVIGAERSLAFAEVPDAVALAAWLHKDALIAALDREIDAESDDKVALTHEQRQQREAEAMGDLLDAERQEAELVFSAQSQGLPIEHRSGISPVALLGVRLVTAPRADLPPTSPERVAYDIAQPTRR